jgi:hypothetical protein
MLAGSLEVKPAEPKRPAMRTCILRAYLSFLRGLFSFFLFFVILYLTLLQTRGKGTDASIQNREDHKVIFFWVKSQLHYRVGAETTIP